MDVIHGYRFDRKQGKNSPNGKYYMAESGGKKYFLKQFSEPKFPREGSSHELYAREKRKCDEWLSAKRELIRALNELGDGTGNIVSPRDVFRDGSIFYQVTYWVDVQTKSLEQIKEYSFDEKIMLLKTYSAALKKVHSKKIIHGDLKPDNILIGASAKGLPAAKLIDFDDSYFSGQAFPPENTVVTDAYQSPELAAYKFGHLEYREKLTCASDVFASGIIFHQFWCGDMPEYPGKQDGKFVYEAVAAGQKCMLHESIPDWLQNLIQAMLSPLPEDRPTMEEVHLAVSERNFKRSNGVDFSTLDRICAYIPKDLTNYTTSTVATLNEVCGKIPAIRKCTDQATIDMFTKVLYAALKNLQKSTTSDYSKINKILSVIPKDLSEYTAESVATLKKIIRLVEANRDLSSQEDVDKLTKILFAAFKGLKIVEAGNFSIRPADTLPNGYAKVKILSEDKVCVYTSTGAKMTLPRVTAQSMGLVVPK